jgi:hypothetical protein
MNGGGGGGGYSCCCCVIGFGSSLNFMMEHSSSNIPISTKFMFSTHNEIIMGLMIFKLQAKTNAMAELTMGMEDKTQQQYNYSSHSCIPNSWCSQRSSDQISEWELEGGNANGRHDDAGLRFSLLQLNLFSDQQA